MRRRRRGRLGEVDRLRRGLVLLRLLQRRPRGGNVVLAVASGRMRRRRRRRRRLRRRRRRSRRPVRRRHRRRRDARRRARRQRDAPCGVSSAQDLDERPLGREPHALGQRALGLVLEEPVGDPAQVLELVLREAESPREHESVLLEAHTVGHVLVEAGRVAARGSRGEGQCARCERGGRRVGGEDGRRTEGRLAHPSRCTACCAIGLSTSLKSVSD